MIPYSNYDFEQFREKLKKIGALAKHYNQTLTFHPGQYNQITSHRLEVVDQSIIDIDLHAKILDLMERGDDSIIVIHGGSKRDGKQVSLDRLCDNFQRLSDSARKRLVLENCEMAYCIEDLLPVSQKIGVPIVIDYHHHNIHPGTIKSDNQLLEITKLVLEIWNKRVITPLFHLSESRPGITLSDSITARRAHSDYVHTLPLVLLETLKNHRINLDIEAKMKEQAVLRLQQKYNIKN